MGKKKYLGQVWPEGTAKTQEEWAIIRKQWEKDYPLEHWFEEKIEKGLWWPTYRFLDKYFNFVQHYREIKYFFQRGIRGWSDRDTWCFCSYIARVNKEAITHLKTHRSGWPCGMFEFTEFRNPTPEEDKQAKEKWIGILNDIIFAFQAAENISNQDWYEWNEKTEDYYKKLREENPELYKDTRLMNREETERMKKGFALYAEHFFSLWD